MKKDVNIEKINQKINTKQLQIDKIEDKINPLLDKKKILLSEIKSLEEENKKIQQSRLLGVISGIDGIEKLSHTQIQNILTNAAQNAAVNQ